MVGETTHFMINPVVTEIACYLQVILLLGPLL